MIGGVVGLIKWRIYTAAAINGYNVMPTSRDGQRWALSAIVVLADAFKMTQRPLTFIAQHKKGEWSWPIETYTLIDGHTLTATLGAPTAKSK